MRILIIEDEDDLRTRLQQRLRAAGYAVDVAADGREGAFLGEEYPFDLAVVDVEMPFKTGVQVVGDWRRKGISFPVLMLTVRNRWQDKVEALEAGADDYLVKPFQFEELLARIKALLRRAAGIAQPRLNFGPILLDLGKQDIRLHEQPLDLTAQEYKILEYLMLHAGQIVSKSDLTEHVYEQDYDRDSNVIEVFIARLRRKLDPDNRLQPIETLRGRGYRFTLERTPT